MLRKMLSQDKNFKKFLGGHSPSPHPLGASILMPSALAPHSKILDPPLTPTTVLAAALTSAPSLGRRLEADFATVTSAAAVAPAVAWAGSQPSRPQNLWSPVRQIPKSYGLVCR